MLYLDQGGRKRISFGDEGKVAVGDVRLVAEWAIKKQEGSEEFIYSSVSILMSFIDSILWLTFSLKYLGFRYPMTFGRPVLGLWKTLRLVLRCGKSTDQVNFIADTDYDPLPGQTRTRRVLEG